MQKTKRKSYLYLILGPCFFVNMLTPLTNNIQVQVQLLTTVIGSMTAAWYRNHQTQAILSAYWFWWKLRESNSPLETRLGNHSVRSCRNCFYRHAAGNESISWLVFHDISFMSHFCLAPASQMSSRYYFRPFLLKWIEKNWNSSICWRRLYRAFLKISLQTVTANKWTTRTHMSISCYNKTKGPILHLAQSGAQRNCHC